MLQLIEGFFGFVFTERSQVTDVIGPVQSKPLREKGLVCRQGNIDAAIVLSAQILGCIDYSLGLYVKDPIDNFRSPSD
jgi:hypothetical protein